MFGGKEGTKSHTRTMCSHYKGEKRGKKKKQGGKKTKSKEASLSNHRTVITVAAAGSKQISAVC